jgi:putative addiction module antidote
MIQKLLKVGSSAAVTIPKKSLKELGLKVGDSISLSFDRTNKRVTIEASTNVDAELVSWTRKFINQYRPALEALAKE